MDEDDIGIGPTRFATVVWAVLGWAVLALAVFYALWWLATPAVAHDAPSGWSYPVSCCSGIDCNQIPETAVKETLAIREIKADLRFVNREAIYRSLWRLIEQGFVEHTTFGNRRDPGSVRVLKRLEGAPL